MDNIKTSICKKVIEPIKKLVHDCITVQDYIGLIIGGIWCLGILFLFGFLFYDAIRPLTPFEEWKEQWNKQGEIGTGVAVYQGSYRQSNSTVCGCFLIKNINGEIIQIAEHENSVLSDSKYEGLPYLVYYVKNDPENFHIRYDHVLHDTVPIQQTYGTIKRIHPIKDYVRITFTCTVKTMDGNCITTDGNWIIKEKEFLPRKYKKLCKQLKRQKTQIPINIYPYYYTKKTDLEAPFKLPNYLRCLPYSEHPWVACVDRTFLENL